MYQWNYRYNSELDLQLVEKVMAHREKEEKD
jgi:hypothetical protein